MANGADAVKDNAHCPVENWHQSKMGVVCAIPESPENIHRTKKPKPKLEIYSAPLTYTV